MPGLARLAVQGRQSRAALVAERGPEDTADTTGDVPAFIVEDDNLFEVFEPILRADCEAVESYVYAKEPLLSCPVTAIRATRDALVNHEDALGWEGVTQGPFSMIERGGDHNLLMSHPEELAAGLAVALQSASQPEYGAER